MPVTMLRRAALALVAVVALASCSSSDASSSSSSSRGSEESRPSSTTTAPDTAPGWEQRRGQAALVMIRYPWPRLGYRVHFRAARSGVIALNFPGRKTIEVYVRPNLSTLDLAHIVAHELGHAHDLKYLDDRQRNEWKKIRGFPEAPGWMEGDAASDFDRPGGDFAEVFAYWAIGRRGIFKSELSPRPDDEQMSELEKYLVPR